MGILKNHHTKKSIVEVEYSYKKMRIAGIDYDLEFLN